MVWQCVGSYSKRQSYCSGISFWRMLSSIFSKKVYEELIRASSQALCRANNRTLYRGGKAMITNILYAVRDKTTGKLVSDLTSKHKKYWEQYNACRQAIQNSYRSRDNIDRYEIVTFELVEVKK